VDDANWLGSKLSTMFQHPAMKMVLPKMHRLFYGRRCVSKALMVFGSVRVSIMSDQTSAPESQKPPRILVIDECQDIQKLIGAILSPTKVRLGFASGGEEGLRMAAASVPALILLDYQMPDCDGLEVLRRLRMDDIAMYEAKDAGRGCYRIFDAFNRLKLGAR